MLRKPLIRRSLSGDKVPSGRKIPVRSSTWGSGVGHRAPYRGEGITADSALVTKRQEKRLSQGQDDEQRAAKVYGSDPYLPNPVGLTMLILTRNRVAFSRKERKAPEQMSRLANYGSGTIF